LGIKITHITEAWGGGISTYVNSIMGHQIKSDKYSEISHIYSQNLTQNDFFELNDKKKYVRKYPYTSSRNPLKILSISKKINQLLRDINPDIVHLHSTLPGVYGRLFKEYPVIYCPHGWSFIQEKGYLNRKIYLFIEKYLSKNTELICNISEYETLQAKTCGVLAKKNILIRSGVRDIIKSNNEININLNKAKINLLYIGRLDYKKGINLLINSINKWNLSNISLYVIGDYYREKTKININSHSVNYLGRINNNIIDHYIKLFDVVVVPSLAEGFSLVPLETMRNSKPIIVSSASSLPEVVIDGYNGLMFDINRIDIELKKILMSVNKTILKEMGNNARLVYESCFTEEIFANKLDLMYDDIYDNL